MAERDHIRNPVEWTADQVKAAGLAVGHTGRAVREHGELRDGALPAVRRIGVEDLRDALVKGLDDFLTYRTDVMFLCIIYPLAGLVLAWSLLNYDFIPLLFPLASGFALLGPVAAVGLYEMSRRRELGEETDWSHAFEVVKSSSFGAIFVLGLLLAAIFAVWILGGLVSLASALALGELVALLPRVGGKYVYAREAFGPLSGFLYGWTLFMVIQTGTIAAVAVGFAR